MSSREEILRNAGLPERIAPLLEGETPEELTASAREVAGDLGIKPAASEAVILARRAIAHAERVRAMYETRPDPEAGVAITSEPRPSTRIPTNAERKEAIVAAIHPPEADDAV